MRAMILAAGRGSRMGELTETIPKPLLRVSGKYLIEFAISSLVRAGINEIVINISYQREQIKNALGNGERYGATFFYSEEPERLETGGGIVQALPLLGSDPFLVMSSDIVSDYPIKQLPQSLDGLAHLVMVNNPDFHPYGDFGLENGRAVMTEAATLTFGNIAILHPNLFAGCKPNQFPLRDLLYPAIQNGKVTGELYRGKWYNIGTPEDLQLINNHVQETLI